jgi:hypothetical protein
VADACIGRGGRASSSFFSPSSLAGYEGPMGNADGRAGEIWSAMARVLVADGAPRPPRRRPRPLVPPLPHLQAQTRPPPAAPNLAAALHLEAARLAPNNRRARRHLQLARPQASSTC